MSRTIIATLICSAVFGAGTQAIAASDPLTRFLDGIFKKNQQQPPPPVVKKRPVQTRQVPKRPQPATVIVRDAQQKHEANTFIAVIGDSLGGSLVDGLREAFSGADDIAIVNRTTPKTNLTRASAQDWIFLTRDYTRESQPNPEPITLGVVFIGADEQRTLLDIDGTEAKVGSPRWITLMTERVDTLIRTFADRRIPLVWVGLPPMKPEAQSTTASTLNALYREEVLKAGGVFVDIWAAFSNDEKGFISSGPDVKGQEARLRTPDGIGLTPSGGRKVAHFTELEIRRLLQARGMSTVIAITTPDPASDNSLGKLKSLPDVLAPSVISVKPIAGPILPLLSIQPASNGKLQQKRPVLKGDAAIIARRVYDEGLALEPIAGRADDFSWPSRMTEQQAKSTSGEETAPQQAASSDATSSQQTAIISLP
ncbi:hypothetical protein [Pseudochelatococcus sp. G4_1912]|uniref:SGNH/GDSL hydrolase family protein n=1 Tax=Pseudochelatococcus sp. G4_1912 TaxID=3114288 RepID=UPI0039C6815F